MTILLITLEHCFEKGWFLLGKESMKCNQYRMLGELLECQELSDLAGLVAGGTSRSTPNIRVTRSGHTIGRLTNEPMNRRAAMVTVPY